MSDEIITIFTDYNIAVPEYFLGYIQGAINQFDLPGVTNGRIEAIKVSEHHPLVQITGALLAGQTPQMAGLLPSISVIEGDENEESTTIGQGLRNVIDIDTAWLDDFVSKYPTMKDRILEGILTDEQIQKIRNAIEESAHGKVCAIVREYFTRENIFIGLWAHTGEECRIIGRVLRAIKFNMKLDMIGKGGKDVYINTSRGLTNFNYGRTLYGEETEMSFLNVFKVYTVVSNAYDPENIDDVDVFGTYKAAGYLDNTVTIYPE